MTQTEFKALVMQSLFAPRQAAQQILRLGWPRHVLWLALALMSVLNALVYSVTAQMMPPPGTGPAMMPPILQSPLVFALALFGALALTVLALQRIGQFLDGGARFDDMLALVTWLQVLRLGLQLAVVVLSLVAPGLGAMLVIVGSVWGLVILAAFVQTAHGFEGRGKAIGVIMLAVLAMAVGLSVLISTLGVMIMGVS